MKSSYKIGFLLLALLLLTACGGGSGGSASTKASSLGKVMKTVGGGDNDASANIVQPE